MNRDLFGFIYQGDGFYLITYNDEKLVYIDTDNFNIDLDKMKTKEDETRIMNQVIDELLEIYYPQLRELYLENERYKKYNENS